MSSTHEACKKQMKINKLKKGCVATCCRRRPCAIMSPGSLLSCSVHISVLLESGICDSYEMQGDSYEPDVDESLYDPYTGGTTIEDFGEIN